jgi:hypothetical protein
MLKIKHYMLTATFFLFSGCASGPKLARVESNLAEESRRLTSAVVDALQLQPAEQRDVYSSTALHFARQDQRIEGIALDPIDVPVLLGIGAVAPEAKAEAEARLAEEFARTNQQLKKRELLKSELISAGVAAEEEHQRKVRFWAKFAGVATLPIAALIALFVFVPAAMPIFGRVLAWLVGKLPSLAGAFGVVSVKAFDAVVKGIERSRQQTGESISGAAPTGSTSTFPNEEAGASRRGADDYSGPGWLSGLELNLSRSMDQAHKTLVQRRKLALGLS